MGDLAQSMRAALDAGDHGATLTGGEMSAVVRMGEEIERLRALVEFYEQGGKPLSQVKAEIREP